MTVSNFICFVCWKLSWNTKTLAFVSTPSNYPRLWFFFFGFFFHNLRRCKWQYRAVYHERGRGRQLTLAKEKSLDLFADAWVNISGSNQSGLKITFSAEFEVFNGFNNLEQNRCLTISSCIEETGLIYVEN